MNQSEMIQSLRAEIAKLQRVLDLLLEGAGEGEEARRQGQPKTSSDRSTSFNPEEFAPKKGTMSAEGKARIAAAQRKRWEAQKASKKRGSKAARAVPTRASAVDTRRAGARKETSAATKTSAKSNKAAGKKSEAQSRSVRPGTRTATKQASSTAEAQTAS